MDDQKVGVHVNWPTPPRMLNIYGDFLGLAKFYRRFIRKFPERRGPRRGGEQRAAEAGAEHDVGGGG